jgi:hypothetical protein
MTSRVTALSAAALGAGKAASPHVFATPEMADRAADEALRDYPPEIADQVRRLWMKESDNDVAVMLRQGAVSIADTARFPNHAKISANVPFLLSDHEMRMLVELYPEMKLTFNVTAAHDHGLAAATRHLDGMLSRADIPVGMRFADFGGDEMTYVNKGEINAVVVKSVLDAKDPMRDVRTEMKLDAVIQRTQGAALGSLDANSYLMASSIRKGEQKFRVNQSLQEYSQKTPVGIMNQVYDVPLADIAPMMERCDMRMLNITVHFSNRFFDTDSGELPSMGGRYRIDRRADSFEFGLVGSGAKWYHHKWSQFQRYGADQILSGKTRRYSYKIIQRRGDTIRARVLEIGGGALVNQDQYYRVPDVPCVRVTADLGRTTHGHGARVDETYPQDIWNRMVRESALDFMRGVTDYSKAVGNYIQMTSGHTYNGQDAVLGTVPPERVPLLVALSAVSGAASVARMRAGIRFGIDQQLDERALNESYTVVLSLKLFVEGLLTTLSAPLIPLVAGLRALARLGGDELMQRLVEVEPVSQLRRIPADAYQRAIYQGGSVAREDFPLREYHLETLELQDFLASVVDDARQASTAAVDLPSSTVEGEETTEGSHTVVGSDDGLSKPCGSGSQGPPAWMPLTQSDMVYERRDKFHSPADRKAAIREEIDVVRQEAYNTEAFMVQRWSQVVVGGKVNKALLLKNRDPWKNLDAWYIDQGVITSSALGKKVHEFCHGGVYCPETIKIRANDGEEYVTNLRHIEEYKHANAAGDVLRVHKVIGGNPYTGWVLVNDATLVHNGPLVIDGLKRALRMPLDFELGVYLGGPGAGKSFEINRRYQRGQQITSPLVLSVDDARSLLVKDHAVPLGSVSRLVRTIDSWLCVAGLGKSVPHCSEVLADEVGNGRAARQYAVWGLMSAKRVVGYGDFRQIPPVDSATTMRLYPRIEPEHVVNMYVIWRYGPNVLAMINEHYDYKLRSARPLDYTEIVWLEDLTTYTPSSSDYAVIGAYQEHKVNAKKYMPQITERNKVATWHETQGKTFDDVCVVELDYRMRPPKDELDLNRNPRYVNVALSRVRKKLTMGSNAPRPNFLLEWYPRSQDPRRVAACADLASAGTSLEKL